MILTGTGQKPPGLKPPDIRPLDKSPLTKSPPPHNEIIIQSYYIFYIDGDIKDILKIKTHPYLKRRSGGINNKKINSFITAYLFELELNQVKLIKNYFC